MTVPSKPRRPGQSAAWIVLAMSLTATFIGAWRAGELAPDGQKIVLCGGLLVSALMYLLVADQARLRRAAETAHEQILRRDERITALNRELEQAVAARTEELNHFKAIIEATNFLVAMADMNQKVTYFNPGGVRMLGYPSDAELAGRPMDSLLTPEAHQLFQEEIYHALMGRGYWSGELGMLTHDGGAVPVFLTALLIRSSDGAPLFFAGTGTDITALKQTEHRLQAALAELTEVNAELARFKAIADVNPDYINITDMRGNFLYMNPGGRRMVGIGPDEDITRYNISVLTPPHTGEIFEREGIPTALREGSWRAEVEIRRVNGREFPISMVGLIIKSATGEPMFMAAVARDITEQRRIAAELQAALAEEKELNRLKSGFISMVTHEIRTPLAAILGSSGILSRYYDRLPAGKRAGYLESIDASVRRMSALMEDVLLFSKAEAGRMDCNPVPGDLHRFCAALVDELTAATGWRCPIRLAATVTDPARMDESLLRHILINLLTNAVKYSPPGTPVTLTVTRDRDSAVFVVRDEGAGIPPDDCKHLFTPFYRGKNVLTTPGTGLGLVIVRHCVECCGGTIEVGSVEQQGTTVTVRLPLFSRSNNDPAPSQPATP